MRSKANHNFHLGKLSAVLCSSVKVRILAGSDKSETTATSVLISLVAPSLAVTSSLSFYEAFKGNMQQLLPACFTTKRKLMGNGILRPTENLSLGCARFQN